MRLLKRFRSERRQAKCGDLDVAGEQTTAANCESSRTARDRLRVARAIVVGAGIGLALWACIALLVRACAGW